MPKAPEPVKSKILSLEQIDSIDDTAPVEVDVPAWGGSVLVRALTLQQISACTKRAQMAERGGQVHQEKRNAWFLVEGLVEPKLSIDVAEKWMTERAAGPVSIAFGRILELSGLTEGAKDAAKSGDEG